MAEVLVSYFRAGLEGHELCIWVTSQPLTVVAAKQALEVQDNGIGFDPGGSFPSHLGLRLMRERAEKLGGILEVTSNPGSGTCIRVRVALLIPGSTDT